MKNVKNKAKHAIYRDQLKLLKRNLEGHTELTKLDKILLGNPVHNAFYFVLHNNQIEMAFALISARPFLLGGSG